MKRLFVWCVTIGLAAVTVAVAGQMWKVSCAACGYSDSFIDSGIIVRGMISGPCTNCRKIVTITWDWQKEKKPEPVATVWDAGSNRELKIFKCPHCAGHFVQILDVKTDLRYCPKCRKPGVRIERGPIVD